MARMVLGHAGLEEITGGTIAMGRKVSTRPLPNWLMRAVALFDPEVRSVLPGAGAISGPFSFWGI